MKTNDTTHRIALDETCDRGEPQFLKIETTHQNGGHSFMTNERSERGVYVSFTLCHGDIENLSTTAFSLFDKRSGKLLAQPCGRKTPSKIKATAALVDANVDKIVEAWKAQDFASILPLIGAAKADA